MAGKIDVFCFDKTGTLTEEGLSVYGYRVSASVNENQSVFGRFHPNTKGFQPSRNVLQMLRYLISRKITQNLFC